MATLEQVMKTMSGVGEAEKFQLASFLERNQIRGAKGMEKVLKLGHKQRHDREKAQEFSFGRLRKFGFIQSNVKADDDV